MSYLKYFMDESKPIVKRQFVTIEEDWTFLESVFPEPGFRSYFLGHVVSKLATTLKANGINSFHDRQQRPELTSITRVLSGIQIAWSEDHPNGRGRVDSACHQNADGKGDSTSAPSLADCETPQVLRAES